MHRRSDATPSPRPGWLRDVGLTAWLLVGVTPVPGRRRLDPVAHAHDRPAGDRRRRDRGGRVSAGRLARAPPGPAGVGRRAAAARARRARRRGVRRDRRRASRARAATSATNCRTPRTRSPAGSRTSASTRAPPSTRSRTRAPPRAARSMPCWTAWRRASRVSPRSVFFLSLTALSLFFLLKDGPAIRAWAERHLGVPRSDRAHDQHARRCSRCAATSSA